MNRVKLSDDCESEVRRLVGQCKGTKSHNGSSVEVIIRAIAVAISDYSTQKDYPLAPDVELREWMQEIINRINALSQRLLQDCRQHAESDNMSFCSHLGWNRRNLRDLCQQLQRLKESAEFVVRMETRQPKRGVPRDGARRHLVLEVARALAENGIPVTTTPTGTFGLVIEQVFAEVGLSGGVSKAIRIAQADLPAWQATINRTAISLKQLRASRQTRKTLP